MEQKGFSLILIILGIMLVIGIASGTYYFSRSTSPKPSIPPTVTSQSPQPNSSDETANWKIYTGSGFTIKYPPSLEYTNLTTINPTYNGLKSASCTGFQTTGAMADILFSVCTTTDSADKVFSDLKTYINQVGGSLGQIIDGGRQVDFSDFNGTELITENKSYQPSVIWSYLIISKNNSTYVISHFKNKEEDLMFSTFKFTEQTNNIISGHNKDEVDIRDLIRNFYGAFAAPQSGRLLFTYMSPPVTSLEKGEYSWLTGADLGQNAFYRVFSRVKLSKPSIISINWLSDKTAEVTATDEFQSYSQSSTEWSKPMIRNVVFTVVKFQTETQQGWEVDKFTYKGTITGTYKGTEKYNGFPNLDSN